MSIILDEHRQYLSDDIRSAAFRQAIHETVRPGDIVLDLGAGTGILGLMACRAGAARVYSIDSGGVIELARKLCEANGYQDRVTFVKGMSTRVELPERVDVVVADQIGFGSEFGLFQFFDDARERHLKPGGKMIPARVDIHIAPTECSEVYDEIDFWGTAPAGFDFAPARQLAANTFYRPNLSADHLLGVPAKAASVSLLALTPAALNLKASFAVVRAGKFHGIGGWFAAQLSPSVCISNSPLAQQPIDRSQVFFPIDQPIDLCEGDQIEITMHILTADHVVAWRVEVQSAADQRGGLLNHISRSRFSQSTWKGMLIAQEDLQKTRPDFIPTLKPRAEVWQTALRLCNGRRSVAEIEREIYQRHPDLFRSPTEVASFVAEFINTHAV